MKNKNIVMLGLQSWDIKIGSNCKDMALELAKENKVIYINMPLDTYQALKNRNSDEVKFRKEVIREKASKFLKVNDNLMVYTPAVKLMSINWLPDGKIFDYFNYLNNKYLAKEIKSALDELNIYEFILFNDSSMMKGFYLKELLHPSTTIYYIRDNLISQPYFRKHGFRLEPKLVSKSDLVITNSQVLCDYALLFNENAHYVGQGCDLSLFNPKGNYSIPTDIQHLRKPIVGYVGNITSSRLDIHLLEQLIASSPEYDFVFVGPQDFNFQQSKIHQHANAHFLGNKPAEVLAQYVNSFKVCLNPQLINALTIGNYPRKIDEYLAMGKPVVATHTRAMLPFAHVVSLVKNVDQYRNAIRDAIKTNSDSLIEQRIRFANSHTWKNCINEISNILS